MTRVLYVARHGEADGDLTEAGRRQADLLGARLRDAGIQAVHHSPAPRATQTAELLAPHLPGIPVQPCDLVGDHVPYLPTESELPPDFATVVLTYLDHFTEAARTQGPQLARQALDRFTAADDRVELIITHSQIVTWFVRAALEAPLWRWLGQNAANAALTIIRYRPGRPAELVIFNDQSHLPPELRWTGFP